MYVIVRTENAGCFAGDLADGELTAGRIVTLTGARRLWYWAGAASLSELAQRGTSKPADCKFPMAVDRIQVAEVIEVIDVTDAARESIDSVPVWSA